MMLVAVFAVLVFAYGLVARRLEETLLTGPMLFAMAGMATAAAASSDAVVGVSSKTFLHLAETGLVLLLFVEAAGCELSALWSFRELPARLLGIGLPLTILLGAAAAWLILSGLDIWAAAILAAILAPTDAGLGQVIVTSPQAPSRVRQALNVEAGLNDGLAVPFLLFFMALAALAGEGATGRLFGRFVTEQLGYGIAVGLAIGFAGGLLAGLASRRQWMSPALGQAAILAVPALCLMASEEVGASMFIAAFVGGIALQLGGKETAHSLEFSEIAGQVLNLLVFFLFGMMVLRDWHSLDLRSVLYAVASLTVVRMVAVAIAMTGLRLGAPTLLFLGWFGPRGLASIVLGLVFLEQEIHLAGEATIRSATIATVLLSIFAHGLTARPGIALYARALSRGRPAGDSSRTDGRMISHVSNGCGASDGPRRTMRSARLGRTTP